MKCSHVGISAGKTVICREHLNCDVDSIMISSDHSLLVSDLSLRRQLLKGNAEYADRFTKI